MRILHILDHSIPLHSGYAFRTLALLREQRALGWETVQLTSPKQEDCELAEEEIDGWHFFRTPSPIGGFSRIPGVGEAQLMGELAHRLEQVVKSTRPHVLHAHSPVLNALPALRVGRRVGIPVVYEVRALWEDAAVDHGTAKEWGLRYRLTRALETFALKHADAVTTICEGLRLDILSRGIPSSKVTVIPNAVDVEKFSLGGVPDSRLRLQLGLSGARVLGFVGSFYAYEGLALILRALPAILAREPHARVLFVGGGPDERRLKSIADELGIREKVVFAGRVPHNNVQRYYDLVEILLYPRLPIRLTELVTPLKPLEAMAQGRLLIASDVGGHRELIRDGETGILFTANDVDSLTEKVLWAFENPAIATQLRGNGRRFVESERTWRQSAARYERVYRSCAQLST